MQLPVSHLRSMPLPRPARGESSCFRLGRLELVLEPVRGGYSLLCLDGQHARTWSLGLADEGELRLTCRVPRLPMALALKDTLVLVPGGRVRGFVHIALVPTITWQDAGGREQIVAELLPERLTAESDEARGTCVQRWTSPFFQRLPPPAEEPRAVLPLAVRNDGLRTQSPAALPLELDDRELRPCRGHLMAAPRLLRLADDGCVRTEVRARLLRGSS